MSTEGKRVWKLDVGPHWDEMQADSEMTIVTADNLDLSKLTPDQIRAAIGTDNDAARELNTFRHQVVQGDVVVAYDEGQVVGVGQVALAPAGEYQYAPGEPQGGHQRKVIWQVISDGIPIPDRLGQAEWLASETPDFVPITDPESVDWILRLL